ncbi:MAG: ABC transporter permease [Prevotellaceae bacterium]|jgi:putative ABC transport system permease protein|nr:ABC transporter permease [Prevotellaceae bacterium]
MFDLDLWQEIFDAIRKNKLRTFLTGFSVAWGIFMLIILLSAGNGLKNSVMSNFAGRAINTVEVWGGRISIPFKGLPTGRHIRLDNNDVEMVGTRVHGAGNVGADLWTGGVATVGSEYASCQLCGVYPDIRVTSDIDVLPGGRFINEVDMRERRKVALINERLKTVLFKGENPVGQYVKMLGVMFQVVGVYDLGQSWGDGSTIYIPFSTAQQLFSKGYGVNSVIFTVDGLNTRNDNELFNAELRKKFAALHRFDPNDLRAVGIYNQMDNYLQTLSIFNAISIFLWIIGIGTLTAGVVGVSNIMLITVRERTREFGIRKALGASPASILRLILLESVLITGLFGYVGMALGVGVSEAVSAALEASSGAGGGDGDSGGITILKNPTVDVNIALLATLVLMVAGVVAGYFPARKAIRITAVEAMKTE